MARGREHWGVLRSARVALEAIQALEALALLHAGVQGAGLDLKHFKKHEAAALRWVDKHGVRPRQLRKRYR